MSEEPKEVTPGMMPAPEDEQAGLDTASESLTRALRLCFMILTVVIFLLIGAFFARGVFSVEPGEKALVLRFGAADVARVLDEGVHYHFPYPIDEVVFINTQIRSLPVNTFWPKLTAEARRQIAEGKLTDVPGGYVEDAEGGYLLTGDRNIIESRWTVQYELAKNDKQAIIRYFNTFGAQGDQRREEQFVRLMTQSVVVREIAKTPVLFALGEGRFTLRERVERHLAEELDAADVGLILNGVALHSIVPPQDTQTKVTEAFRARREAEEEKKRLIEAAKQKRTRSLTEAAGGIGEELREQFTGWWDAYAQEDQERMDAVETDIITLMTSTEAGGDIKNEILAARAYKADVINRAAEHLKYVQELAGAEQSYLEVLRVEAMGTVLRNAMETFLWAGSGDDRELEVIMNRLPQVMQEQSPYKVVR